MTLATLSGVNPPPCRKARWACLVRFPGCQLSEFSVLFSFKGPHPQSTFFPKFVADPLFWLFSGCDFWSKIDQIWDPKNHSKSQKSEKKSVSKLIKVFKKVGFRRGQTSKIDNTHTHFCLFFKTPRALKNESKWELSLKIEAFGGGRWTHFFQRNLTMAPEIVQMGPGTPKWMPGPRKTSENWSPRPRKWAKKRSLSL